ncbi:ash family protein [Serratia marcescens]
MRIKPAHAKIMVAQAGQPMCWPVSFGTGVENPVWATTL